MKFCLRLVIEGCAMTDRAVIRLIVLIILIPINRLSCRWISKLMYQAAGKTKKAFKGYLISTNSSVSPLGRKSNMFYSWMLRGSPNQKRFKILYKVYLLSTMPNIIILHFAILGLLTHTFDVILDYATVAMIVLPIILSVAGVIYRKTRKSKIE